MAKTEYVNVIAHGFVENVDEIIITIYGPQGGKRACESTSPEGARSLRDQLNEALAKFDI